MLPKSKGFFICLALAMYYVVLCDQEIKQSIYIKGIRCNFSTKWVLPRYKCFAKSYSRTLWTGNVMVKFKVPMNEIFVDVQIFYKYGTIYREVIHTPRFEWCQLMEDYVEPKMPSPMSFLVQVMNDSAPEIIHKCPYTEFVFANRSVVTAAAKSVFPRGEYRATFSCYTKDDEKIGSAGFYVDVNPTYKETFG